ncbi:hypothetical protein CYMTET_44413, partial [Cymbomonas tetramitiformis]
MGSPWPAKMGAVTAARHVEQQLWLPSMRSETRGAEKLGVACSLQPTNTKARSLEVLRATPLRILLLSCLAILQVSGDIDLGHVPDAELSSQSAPSRERDPRSSFTGSSRYLSSGRSHAQRGSAGDLPHAFIVDQTKHLQGDADATQMFRSWRPSPLHLRRGSALSKAMKPPLIRPQSQLDEERLAQPQAGPNSSAHTRPTSERSPGRAMPQSFWRSGVKELLGRRPPGYTAVTEWQSGKACARGCSNAGVCNAELGACFCRSGWTGVSCETPDLWPCDHPDGRGVVTRCAGQCSTENNRCYCGEHSKYPDRPMQKCLWDGVDLARPFQDPAWDNWPHAPKYHFWGTNRSYCDMDPQSLDDPLFDYCRCHDGTGGRLCASTVEASCLNQCSQHGECLLGFCKCHAGFFGVDCSRRAHSPSAEVTRPRPLVYVYELPGRFNVHMLERRTKKEQCVIQARITAQGTGAASVPDVADESRGKRGPRTMWSENLYGAEVALHEALLRSPHRTTNAEEADLFFVPVYGACFTSGCAIEIIQP